MDFSEVLMGWGVVQDVRSWLWGSGHSGPSETAALLPYGMKYEFRHRIVEFTSSPCVANLSLNAQVSVCI